MVVAIADSKWGFAYKKESAKPQHMEALLDQYPLATFCIQSLIALQQCSSLDFYFDSRAFPTNWGAKSLHT